MNQQKPSQIWILLGVLVGGAALAALLLLFLSREPTAPAPVASVPADTPAPVPTSGDPIVAQVNTETIRLSTWRETVMLDQIMSGLAGQPAPVPEETLQRMVNEALVLQKLPPAQAPTQEAIERQITAMAQTWAVEDETLTAELEAAGLSRADMERAVDRLLRVQSGLETFESQAEVNEWLTAQRTEGNVQIFEENLAALTVPTPRPSPAADDAAPSPSPSPQPPVADVPAVAPDFTLPRASGGTFTLSKQLEEGPVVLIFFQKCA